MSKEINQPIIRDLKVIRYFELNGIKYTEFQLIRAEQLIAAKLVGGLVCEYTSIDPDLDVPVILK